MVSMEAHIKEIEQVAVDGVSQRDRPVLHSWMRCLNQYKLDPTHPKEAYVVPEQKLREHQEQAQELIRISSSSLNELFDQVVGQDYILLLSDARGIAVDFLRDPALDDQLYQAGLYLGAEWSENRAGTNAVGASLVSGQPVVIHQDDHFDSTHIALSCTAAPIYDTLGEMAAVL